MLILRRVLRTRILTSQEMPMSKNKDEQQLKPANRQSVFDALSQIPSGLFILTAAYEDKRLGMLASWVQQVGFEPPTICVAVAKGRSIMPLISESHHFGLCQIATNDRILPRKFSASIEPGDDPFLGYNLLEGQLPGLPILANAHAFLECELACHMDVESDHDLFVGRVVNGRILGTGQPLMRLRDSGESY